MERAQEGFLDPQKIIDFLKIPEDVFAAEFGCGAGDFAVLLAKKAAKGRIFAFDIQKEVISSLKGRIAMEKLENIFVASCDLEAEKGTGLKDGFLDIGILANVLFQSENRQPIMRECARTVRKGGTILVVDWLPEASQGPKFSRVSPEETKFLAKESGLKFKQDLDAGKFHFCQVFVKLGT